MRTLITIAAAALLAACAGQPVTLAAQPVQRQVQAVATLATSSCELATAADYTATESAVRKATARVRDGTMAPAAAQRVADDASHVRRHLAATCSTSKTSPDPIAHARARAAMANVLKGVQ